MEAISADAILLGDVNAVGTWDPRHANDAYRYSDRILEEKLLEKGFEVLNDGSTTRSSTNPEGRPSAIDITAAQPLWARHCT